MSSFKKKRLLIMVDVFFMAGFVAAISLHSFIGLFGDKVDRVYYYQYIAAMIACDIWVVIVILLVISRHAESINIFVSKYFRHMLIFVMFVVVWITILVIVYALARLR